MKWMITGGAGYIGSHVAAAMVKAGHQVVVYDDMSTPLTSIKRAYRVVMGDICDLDRLALAMVDEDVQGVMHLAGIKAPEASVLDHYRVNAAGTETVLRAMRDASVHQILYASSAATLDPTSAYGRSKLAGAWMIQDAAEQDQLRAIILRYFNVIGNSPAMADHSPHNLVPKAIASLRKGFSPRVYGDDYSTPDGSTVRDYVDVRDVAALHVKWAEGQSRGLAAYDVGTGYGISTLRVVDLLTREAGVKIPVTAMPRRYGDTPALVSNPTAVMKAYDWAPTIPLEQSLHDAWTDNKGVS